MVISVRLNQEEAALFKKFAELNRQSVSEMIRQAVREKIETEHDLEAWEDAVSEREQNPRIFSLCDVESDLKLR